MTRSNVQKYPARVGTFGKRVRKLLDGSVPIGVLERTVSEWGRMGLADPDNKDAIRKCADVIMDRAQTTLMTEAFVALYGAEMTLTSRALEFHLQSEVQALRSKLFGGPEPPYENLDEATGWIQGVLESSGKLKRQPRLRDPMSYVDPASGWKLSCFVVKGSDLEPLHLFTQRVASDASLPQALVIAHVLVGHHLERGRFEITESIPFGGLPRPVEYTVTFHGPNPTQQDFLTAYESVRRMRTTAPNPIDEQDLELYEAIVAAGRPVWGETAAWWESARKSANKNLKRSQAIKSADAARVRWQRLRDQKTPPGMIQHDLTKPLSKAVQVTQ